MLNPKKWNMFCWVALVLWLLPSIGSNIPHEPTEHEAPPGRFSHTTYLTGWPFTYLEIDQAWNTPPTRQYYLGMIAINLLVIAAILLSIIYSIQTFAPKFSMLTLFVVVTCIAILFSIGKLVFSTGDYYLHFGFIFSIYFSPLIAAVLAFFYSRFLNASANRGMNV